MTFWILMFFYTVVCGYLKKEKQYWGIALLTVVWLIGSFTIPLKEPYRPTPVQPTTTIGK